MSVLYPYAAPHCQFVACATVSPRATTFSMHIRQFSLSKRDNTIQCYGIKRKFWKDALRKFEHPKADVYPETRSICPFRGMCI